MRSGLLILLASCAVMTAPVVAQDDSGSVEAVELSADEQVEELIDEYSAAEQAFFKKVRAAETDEEREKIYENDAPDASKYIARFMDIANANKGTEAAFVALNWIVQNARDPEPTVIAVDAILADHIENEGLVGLCSSLQRNMNASSAAGLEKILAGSPHAAVKGQACFALANHMNDLADMAQKLQDGSASEDYIAWYTENLGEERMAALAKLDVKAVGERAEKLFERVVAEFGDIEARRGTLGKAAEASLFEIRNLKIGLVAPEIEAADLDGVTFKLSDYRGKVVVLDFWGNW